MDNKRNFHMFKFDVNYMNVSMIPIYILSAFVLMSMGILILGSILDYLKSGSIIELIPIIAAILGIILVIIKILVVRGKNIKTFSIYLYNNTEYDIVPEKLVTNSGKCLCNVYPDCIRDR